MLIFIPAMVKLQEYSSTDSRANNGNDVPEDFLEIFMQNLPSTLCQICKTSVEWCKQYPHLAIIGIACILPTLFIFGFGLAWFMALMGMLLAGVSMLMLACLGVLVLVLSILIVVLVAAFFGFSNLHHFKKINCAGFLSPK